MRETSPFASPTSFARVVRLALSLLFVAGLASASAVGCGRSSLEDAILDGGPITDARVDSTTDGGTCGPSTCPTGCCDARGVCRVGSDVQACGSFGGKCNDCIASGFDVCESSRKVCGKRVPTCDATSCATGCCVTSGGTGVCLSGTDASACGQGGATCSNCATSGQACDPRLRTCSTTKKCDATNCNGCCVGDLCLAGTDGSSCGNRGAACQNCVAQGTTCGGVPGGGGQCQGIGRCGPQNCGGCCDARGTCTEGIDSTSCGRGGEACNDCTPRSQVCAPRDQPNGRTCIDPPPCGPLNCAGCCIGNVCTLGTQDTACGQGGPQCTNCAGANQTCGAGGVCTGAITCGPANCRGCCDGNTCVVGNDPAQCGAGGLACRACGVGGTCNAGTCSNPACSAANCPGCCQADRCLAGFTNRSCGSAGAACADCFATSTTCNTLANPRACGVPSTCPANYGACPAAVTQPVLPQNTNVCAAVTLQNAQAACAGGSDTVQCTQFFAFLAAVEPTCGVCLGNFKSPFFDPNFPTFGKGLSACVAPFVSAACQRSLGCSQDCIDTSCTQCPLGAGPQCKAGVTQPAGQCAVSAAQAAQCGGVALLAGPAAVCNPQSYGFNYGNWLAAVGARFCGP